MTQMGLYYPFIRIQDEAWLKVMALYWARLGKIKPISYLADESTDSRILRDEAGFLFDVEPPVQARHNASQLFGGLIYDHGDELRALYGLGDYLQPAEDVGRVDRRDMVREAKLQGGLVHSLLEHGLAERPREGDRGRLRMHPALASVYMTCLARETSNELDMSPVTDQEYAHLALGAHNAEDIARTLLELWSHDEVRRVRPDITSQYLSLAFQVALPSNIERLDIREIVRIREELSGPLTAFRDHVEAQASSLQRIAMIEDEGIRNQHLELLVERTAAAPLKQLEKEMRVFGEVMRVLFDMQTLTPPALLTAATTPVNNTLFTAGTAAAATAISATWTAGDRRRRAATGSPVSFLLALRRREPSTLLRAFARRLGHVEP